MSSIRRPRCLPAALTLALVLGAVPIRAQAHLVADLYPGALSGSPYHSITGSGAMAVLGERVVFAAFTATGVNLYASDGTAAGTTLVTVLDDTAPYTAPAELVTVGSRVFFAWADAATGTELWATDGTAAGTAMVKDILPGPGLFSSNPTNLAAVGGLLYFSARDSTASNYELWRSDGTAVGTFLVKDIHPTASSSPAGMTALGSGGTFLFAATHPATGRELWLSDGTAAGTVLVADLVPGAGTPLSSNPLYLTPFGGRVAFSALDRVWLSDGTAAGTAAVTPGLATGARHLAAQGGRLFFQGTSTAHGNELWSTDGTAAGTAMVSNLNVGGVPDHGSFPFMTTPVGSRWVYFAATTVATGEELWRSDGLVVELVADIGPGSASGGPRANGYPGTHLLNSRFAVTADGKVFFWANDGVHGIEPWVMDSGVVAASTVTGAGCGALTLTATTPYLGSTLTLTTAGVSAATGLSANVLSFTSHVPPLDLTGVGMTGCLQHCGLDALVFQFGSPTATRLLVLPNDPTWLGAALHSQSYGLEPTANPLGAISSNGVRLVLGDL